MLKIRKITLPTKVHIIKAMVFPAVMYGCESWTIKKAERWRTDAFELWWCWRRLLRVPWTARRSNQSILKEINSEYSVERLMLKLHYFGHLMLRADLLNKTLKLGKTEGEGGNRGWDGWMASLTQWTWVWASSSAAPWPWPWLDVMSWDQCISSLCGSMWMGNSRPEPLSRSDQATWAEFNSLLSLVNSQEGLSLM